jgi:hypothetical protein
VNTFTVAVSERVVDLLVGVVDSALGVLVPPNPWWNWEPIGPIFGHQGFYTAGNVAGIVAGIGVGIYIGNAAGIGSGLIACGSLLQKAAKAYTVIDTIASAAYGVQQIATGEAGLMTALAFAPAIGYAGGKAGVKLGVLKESCFIAGTSVLVSIDGETGYRLLCSAPSACVRQMLPPARLAAPAGRAEICSRCFPRVALRPAEPVGSSTRGYRPRAPPGPAELAGGQEFHIGGWRPRRRGRGHSASARGRPDAFRSRWADGRATVAARRWLAGAMGGR